VFSIKQASVLAARCACCCCAPAAPCWP